MTTHSCCAAQLAALAAILLLARPASAQQAPDPTVPAPVSQPHTVVAAPQPSAPARVPTGSRGVDDERPPGSIGEHRSGVSWYGYQTLLADLLSVGLMVGTGGSPLVALGFGGAVLAPPIIHFAHDNPWGYVSLALRVVSGTLLFVAFTELVSDNEDGEHHARCGKACLEAGLASYGAAVVLDASVFSLRTRPAFASRERAMVAPMLAPGVLGAGARVAF